MNLQLYQARKNERLNDEPQYRQLCMICRQPEFSCYCADVQKFNPRIQFVILIHPIEVRRRIATGRMSHLCLENSRLIAGQDYSEHPEVNALLTDPNYHAVILYPGRDAMNLSDLPVTRRSEFVPIHKKLLIFVIDGTWATAGKMLRSENLCKLPQICFSPVAPSNFRVRKQPEKNYLSTLEAIYQVIDLLGPSQGFNTLSNEHGKLIHVFNQMVERQLECKRKSEEKYGGPRRRRICRKKSALSSVSTGVSS